MKKYISLLLAAVLLLTITTGCRKNKNDPTEVATQPETEAATQETEKETTAPTVDVLKDAPSAFEDKPEETTSNEENTKPVNTTPPITEAPAPPPEDNSDNDLGWG